MAQIIEPNAATIFSSREQIRAQLTDYCQQYLELENVDLYKTSFLSYIINILSALSANQLFYTSTVYRELFLIYAQMQESVYNLSKWIGYNIPNAVPASVDVLFTMPLGFKTTDDITFQIPSTYQVTAGTIPFTIQSIAGGKYTFNAELTSADYQTLLYDFKYTTVQILNNKLITVRDANGFYYPVQVSKTGSYPTASFILPFLQYKSLLSTFQIPNNLEFYQFYSYKVTGLNGQISSIDVYVIPSDNTDIDITQIDSVEAFEKVLSQHPDLVDYKWTESTAGLYTLSSDDEKYIWTPLENSIEVTFGNGVLGKQPERGSNVIIISRITNGASGNVVAGSITTKDPLYYTGTSGSLQRLSFDIINPSSAIGGADSPSLQEIKNNAISNLTSKNRLVSDIDYNNFNTIASEVPIEGSIPILKRSDLKINEICMFSKLIYNNPNNENGTPEVVPTRNIVFSADTSSYPTLFIPMGSSPIGTNSEFETIFNMQIDPTTNTAAYDYLINDIDISNTLESVNSDISTNIYMSVPYTNISSILDSTANLTSIQIISSVNHIPTKDDNNNYYTFRSYLKTMFDSKEYLTQTITDSTDVNTVTAFEYTFDNVQNLPTGVIEFKLRVETYLDSTWQELSQYSFETTIRRDLSDFMISSVTNDSTDIYYVHDVPVILSEYLTQDNFDKKNFELIVLQSLIQNLSITSKRMLTDFVNIKFPDTYGLLTNMQYNPLSDYRVISRTLSIIPEYDPLHPELGPIYGDTYIVNGGEIDPNTGSRIWVKEVNKLSQWNGSTWVFISPKFDEFIQITNTYDPSDVDNGKKLIWTRSEWMEPIFGIPFDIKAKISIDPLTTSTSSAIVDSIKSTLVSTFATKFGMDVDIDKSEIISVIRSISGVQYCELLEPQVDIKFKYEMTDLTLEQLLDYTPQLVAFTEDTIEIQITE